MTIGLALALLYTGGWASLYVIRTEAFGAALPQYSAAERWSAAGSAVILSVHMTVACVTVSLMRDIGGPAALLSTLTFSVGIVFWLWARAMIGPLRVRRLPDQPPLRLRRAGAFGVVRHPLYLGALIAAAAPLIVAPRLYLLVTYVLCVVALAMRAMHEERRLHAQLGPEYAAYCRDVKRLVPFIW